MTSDTYAYEPPDRPLLRVSSHTDQPIPPVRPNPDAVVIGYLHGADVAGRFHQSLLDLVIHDCATARRTVFGGGGIIELESGPNLSTPRNELVGRFLEHSMAPWLLMLDADGQLPVDLLDRLLEHADPDKAPIVGALVFGAPVDGEIFPTMYDIVGTADDIQPVRYSSWPSDAMFQVFATGAACLLVHRRVFEAIRDYRTDGRGFSQAFPWFQETEISPGVQASEDVTFCLRAGIVGFPVFVNTAVSIGHIKPRLIDHAAFRAQPRPAQPEPAPQAPEQTYDPRFSQRTRERLAMLAAHAREALAPDRREAAERFIAERGWDGLTWVWRDGEVVIGWADLDLVTVDAELLDRIVNDDELSVGLGEMPAVPDDVSGIEDL